MRPTANQQLVQHSQRILSDIEQFLQNGGRISHIPTGRSAIDYGAKSMSKKEFIRAQAVNNFATRAKKAASKNRKSATH